MAGVAWLVADRDIARTHQAFEGLPQLRGVVGRVGRITDLAANLAVQAEPELAGGPVGGSQGEQLALVDRTGIGVQGNGRGHRIAQGQREGLPSSAAVVEHQLLDLAARDLHGGGLFDHAPVVAVGRVKRLGQPQAIGLVG